MTEGNGINHDSPRRPQERHWMAERIMNQVPFTAARILRDLPVTERLVECSMCQEDRAFMVQLGVIGHQIALCGPCIRDIQKAVR